MSPTQGPGPPVRVVYRKYDGSLHWHSVMARLGDDEHGVWWIAVFNGAAERRMEIRHALHRRLLGRLTRVDERS